jgi:hypothetical protein
MIKTSADYVRLELSSFDGAFDGFSEVTGWHSTESPDFIALRGSCEPRPKVLPT